MADGSDINELAQPITASRSPASDRSAKPTTRLDHITAVRFYWRAYGVISGRNGHVSKGPQWTFWRGLHEIAKSMQRLHRGELKPYAPQIRKLPREVQP